jgi:hypothetical protein
MTNLGANSVALTPVTDSLRLFIHVIGATVWVGGQLVLAALVPALKKVNPDLPKMPFPKTRHQITAWYLALKWQLLFFRVAQHIYMLGLKIRRNWQSGDLSVA